MQSGGRVHAGANSPAMHRYLLVTLALLSMLVLAVATPALGQDPETPGGEPQPGEEPPTVDVPGAPAPEETPAEEPAPRHRRPRPAARLLPPKRLRPTRPHPAAARCRTRASRQLWIALAGIVLLLAGARLRVVSRIRAVARRQMTPKVALRASLEELRAVGVAEARRAAKGPPPVEPSTVGARRVAKR